MVEATKFMSKVYEFNLKFKWNNMRKQLICVAAQQWQMSLPLCPGYGRTNWSEVSRQKHFKYIFLCEIYYLLSWFRQANGKLLSFLITLESKYLVNQYLSSCKIYYQLFSVGEILISGKGKSESSFANSQMMR